MSITIHQRVHLYLWHWATGPGWCRSPEIKPLRDAGARVLKVQLQDDGQIPVDIVNMWRAQGLRVWGMVRPSGHPLGGAVWNPVECARWIHSEKRRLVLEGVDLNFEDEVRHQDNETGGQWSEKFAAEFRRLMPDIPAHLDTYYGAAAGGMNLGAYMKRDMRMSIQTFWGPEGLYDDTIPHMVSWCAGANPTIHKSRVKPCIRVSKNNAGQLPDFERIFYHCWLMGTKGVSFYPIDSSSLDDMSNLIRQAIRAGASY